MIENDGGPAFPRSLPSTGDSNRYGMSLRDWFAGQALAGLCGGDVWPNSDDGREMARRAYLFADAMLKAREATP